MLEATIRQAIEMRHELSLANFLAEAGCPIALLSGRLGLADEMIALLRHHTKALSLDVWNNYADCFEAELDLLQGKPSRCLEVLGPSCAILAKSGFVLFQTYFRSVEARALTALGRHADAIGVIDEALTSCAASGERWCLPELLRVKGATIVADGAFGWQSSALTLFHEAAAAARSDGALAWERRIALDFAPLSGDPMGDPASKVAVTYRPEGEPERSSKPPLH